MAEEMKKVNINQADAEELSQIPGIAENLAQRIIEYRETVHPFEEVIELAAVPGISERMVREFADQVTVEPVDKMERAVSVPNMTLEPQAEPAPPDEAEEEAELFEFVTDTEDDEPEEIVGVEAEEVLEADEEEETAVPEPITITPEPATDEDDTVHLPPLVEPEPQPRPVAQPAPQPSQRRMLGPILLGSILGAFVGALLTLAILAALNNGHLSFARQSEFQNAQQAQTDLQQTVDNMNSEFNTNLSSVATRTGDLFLHQQETDASLQDVTSGMQQVNANVAELEAVTNSLDERLTTVAAAAETFNAFLDGLRGLLTDLESGTATAT
ncbi:MAG: helix-hairpin-helix domain-containing protein, partial [Anaerolineae bacterium]